MEKVLRSDLREFAKRVRERIDSLATARNNLPSRATVMALHGELGAGKTTFTQALARELGVVGVVQSPTYVLMKSYPISFKDFTTLVHIDAYRLNSAEEFAALKPETFLHDPHSLVLIEWPERVESALPKPDLTINFSSESAGEGERFVEIQ